MLTRLCFLAAVALACLVPARASAQAPVAPPYKQEDVTLKNGDITLAGTLTLPSEAGRHPAVVLITGSGAENRDEEVFGFKVFHAIADHLTRNGIAVLRCDDRGVGGSSGSTSESTSPEFATDVLAQVAFLKSREEVDPKRIGVLGHSEGGIIGPIAANLSPDIAFVIMMSGPALTGENIMIMQGQRILKAMRAPQAVLDRQLQIQRRIFDVVRKNAGWDELAQELMADVKQKLAGVPEASRAELEQTAARQIEGQLKGVRSAWFRHFLDYDPLPALQKLQCPVLALFGELDLQVPVAENKAAMEKAFAASGNRRALIRVLPKANHLYQAAETGDPGEYTTLKKEFVPELLPLVTAWIRQQGK